ncbi:fido domain-containing protein [Mucidula mucida]|nr:fido domain-containing protein [Mucidula mucida]
MRPIGYVSIPYLDNPPDPSVPAHPAPTLEATVRQFEGLLRTTYPGNPWILLRLAAVYQFTDPGTALAYDQEAFRQLAALDLYDKDLDEHIQEVEKMFKDDAKVNHDLGALAPIIQPWKRALEHAVPLTVPLPSGCEELKRQWHDLFPQGSKLFDAYLSSMAIETNHIESAFLLSIGASQDLIKRGIAEGVVNTRPQSRLHDRSAIKLILNDTLATYTYLQELVNDLDKLSPEGICEVHRRVMDTARFWGVFVPAGFTRSVTRRSVFVGTCVPGTKRLGTALCCPPLLVDDEVFDICERAKNMLQDVNVNPFAAASWLHLVLATCHPFNDGNGSITRFIASIPLLRHGYPPISIPFDMRGRYFDAIHHASNGNHESFIQCLFDGMQRTILHVTEVIESEATSEG